MDAKDLYAAMDAEPAFTSEDRDASFWMPATFNDGMVWIGRWKGESPWERHPDSDELVHVLEGRVEVTLMEEGGPRQVDVSAGSVCVVPRGVWHKQRGPEPVVVYGVTIGRTEHSDADDPRADA